MYLIAGSIDPKNFLTSWKGRKGKFIRTFGINTTRNNNEWKVTWKSIKQHIGTAINRPGIEYEKCQEGKCDLDHVEAESFEENIEKQKPYERTKIIDYILDEENESVDLVHEVNDGKDGDEFFDKVKNGEVQYVSAMVWPATGGYDMLGTGRAGLPIIDAYHWKFVHHAFLRDNPAYGKDTAQVKTTCEGENCQVQLLSAKALSAKTALCGNCKFFVENGKCKLVQGTIEPKAVCNLHEFGEAFSKDTKILPLHTKQETKYRTPLAPVTTSAPGDALNPLKEIPLLYRHKKKLHLVSASSCVQDIIQKKKQAGIKIDDKALAIAYSECDESNKAKSSFKTCTCDTKQNNMPDEEKIKELESKLKAQDEEKKELESKLKSQNEEKEKEMTAKKARYSKLFSQSENDDDGKKMYARLKATTDDKDELKAMDEEYDNHTKSRKAAFDDPEKKELQASNKAMAAQLSAPMIATLVAIRKERMPAAELTEFENSLKAKSFVDIQTVYNNESYIINSLKSKNTTSKPDYSHFEFNGADDGNALAAKSLEELTGDVS